jgi:serine/threonine protein kinase
VTTDIDVNIEPLPGYRLIEHIGTGGYGEVWRAEAPGGLYKAIKFVFGQQHEKRATNELRALDHVRSVRHPFLLSLERIEVVDGRLLVVTELADGSLKDRFDACRRDGLSGIPRAELLKYLRDAADALDFMNESHALQHLDIKPENLLLLAGHVKVADFGLVKDVRQSQASLVGGMTPLYAAPEVFRGAPSRQSDQYSLAIVYQEMLTGTLPFAGGNAAELTLQHLNDEPDLSSLAIADRYAVSRALSKDPQHRYASCREFVENLLSAALPDPEAAETGPRETPSFSSAVVSQSVASISVPTDVFDEGDTANWTESQQMLIELPQCDRNVRDCPPGNLSERDSRPAPTLVLGIGGAAGRVLSHFRKLIHDQFNDASIPAVQFLLLDTDSRALSDAGRRHGAGLAPEETLHLPLCRPQHYRDNAQQLLTWLSRRWLYNIPRTLRTEGLRPLGRLALADHARQAGQRIRRAMMQAMDSAATAASSQVIGRGFRTDAVRVFVVASISGGTGGGMSLDVAYAARTILIKLGLPDARVHGLMMHSTGGDPRSCELARVNALSWLTELHHFQQPTACYPGDASCGLPAHPAGVSAFDSAYLIHLGENLSEVEFDQAVQSVAEYLRLNTLTTAGAFFDACRELPELDGESLAIPSLQRKEASSLRSFGLYQRAAAPSEFCDEFARIVSRHVIASWRPMDRKPDGSKPAGSEQLVRRLQLDAGSIAANARSLIELELGSDATTFLSTWLPTQSAGVGAALLPIIDKLFASSDGNAGDGGSTSEFQGKPVAAIVEPFAEKLRKELRRWALAKVDECPGRIEAARRAVAWMISHCSDLDAELQRFRSAAADNLLEFRREITIRSTSAKDGAEAQDEQQLLTYFCLRLDQAAILAASHVVHLLVCDAKRLSEEVTSLGREIDQIATAVSRACGDTAANLSNKTMTEAATNQARLAKSLQGKLSEMAAEVDQQLQSEYIYPQGGLEKVIMGGGRPRAQLTAKLHELARQVVQRTVAGFNTFDPSMSDGESNLSNELRSGLAAATPTLLEFGGTRQVVAILPRDGAGALTPAVVSNSLGPAATAITGNDNNLVLCVEAGNLSLPHVAASLVEYRRDRVEFASRVHSRTDVAWTPLIDIAASSELVGWPGVDARQTTARDAMCKTLVM